MSGWPRAASAALAVLLGAGSVIGIAALLSATAAEPPDASVNVAIRPIRVDPPPPPAAPARHAAARRQPTAPRAAAPAAARALPSIAAPALNAAPPLSAQPRVAIPPPAFAPGMPGPRIERPLPPVGGGAGGQQVREQTINGIGDAGAELLTALDLERHYPRAARRAGIGGTSNVRLTLSDTGAVTAVEVLASSPEGMFDEAARAACQNLRFRPATRSGVAVASTVDLEIAWTIR